MEIKSNFPFRYFFILSILFLFPFLLLQSVVDLVDGVLLLIGIGSILLFLLCRRNNDYFDPMFLFSIYYVLVYVAALATALRGFENNIFIVSVSHYNHVDYIYTLSLLVCVVSYFSALAGYALFAKRDMPLKPEPISGVGNILFLCFASFFCFIGIANFFYNVFSLYGGDVISYYKHISMRSYDFAQGGTTLGYQFLYAGSYMIFIRYLQCGRGKLASFISISLSILIFFSDGRITNTVFYIASFLMIYYYNKGGVSLNRQFFWLGVAVAVLGVLLYSLRYASSLYYNNLYDFSGGGLLVFLGDFFALDNLVFFLHDKGNIPNFAVLMKVVDSWGRDLGYMFGSTLLYPLYGFISGDLFGLIQMPAVAAKSQWYSDISGGNLPVTGMGEMVVNFSIVGFPIGMFLFGAMGALFRNIFLWTRNNIYLIFYSKVCFFYLLYPKGEFNNFNLFWMAFPSVMFLMSVYMARSFRFRCQGSHA